MVGTGNSIQPFKTVEDYENWIKRASGYSGWVDQAILNMREGMQRGRIAEQHRGVEDIGLSGDAADASLDACGFW